MNNNSNLVNNLRWRKRSPWVDRTPQERSQDKEALARLAQHPDLEVLLRFLEWQKVQAQSPSDLTQTNWQATDLINRGKLELITDIASQLELH